MQPDNDFLAESFESHRSHLRSVAYRMLGSHAEAEDAVQEAWLRLARSRSDDIANLGGWLTTVVGRVCLDMLRTRRQRREEAWDDVTSNAAESHRTRVETGPEQEALLTDSVGVALMIVLDTLEPAERLAFVLHDMFAVPFDEIAVMLDRTPAAARQLASRARRRVQGRAPDSDPGARARRDVVEAFLAAARGGDVDTLVQLLAPDVLARSDAPDTQPVRGAEAVARSAAMFAGRSGAASCALVDGFPGVVADADTPARRAMLFTVRDNRITIIDVVTTPDRFDALDIAPLP
ncbi:sigma-70 family RNA polymerase sigma factor [Yinghuangia sp. ASG 101]|uniref:sigma-70 family RNA polymerase sigma factor n=1 Tax=Yinghuangia sp. ASG 101 TaxID=2896848 RepID=UPI001E3585E1|nr:sigma-70 family RNA polymerase sigma factor [Yinghuangia sp. ASG 101]UGQ10432.1 sigma-70 family RNA polymerase sigma factor [Yinghuangia sp. ASG 101]